MIHDSGSIPSSNQKGALEELYKTGGFHRQEIRRDKQVLIAKENVLAKSLFP